MDWNQIENKWTAMTIRIRADWSSKVADAKISGKRRVEKTDTGAVVRANSKGVNTADPIEKLSLE